MQSVIDEPAVTGSDQPESLAADPRSHNGEILRKIESGVAELESAISRLDLLITEQTRLAGEVQKAATAETELLRDESLSEAAATKELLKIRTLGDVLRARGNVAGERVGEQTDLVLELGATVRRTLARAANEIYEAPQARIRRLFDDLIPPQIETGLPFGTGELAKISRPVVEALRFINIVRASPVPVRDQELEALRKQPRIWFEQLTAFVEIEFQAALEGHELPK
jgi:hypothetical protein